ncbi:hypothetical protein VSDG_00138 [Cytospora chrysosperma]|uniref:Uncharacterized protein n=1 Tax=Cytospora chrysosperma TaxID=252740 RepID=A0A423WPC8_CYTCH|nr:hypothetical protein VSDG_00138 [Valsa sordida]
MSFSLLRVPKKAALTALRGLVVGTSCTLVLVTEDRRRRINQARSAVRTAEKICLVKQYHATRSASHQDSDYAAAVTSLEEGLSSAVHHAPEGPNHKDWGISSRDALGHAWQAPTATTENKGSAQTSRVRTQHLRVADSPSEWRKHRVPPPSFMPPSSATANTTILPKPFSFGVDENVRRMREAPILGDTESLEDAVNILRKTMRRSTLTREDKAMLIEAAGPLCRKCQEVGMMDQAKQTLVSVLGLGPLWELEYYACNPQPIIDQVTNVAASEIDKMKSAGEGDANTARSAARRELDEVTALLLPKFRDVTLKGPQLSDWQPTAEHILDMAFDLGEVDRAADVFWRIQHYTGKADYLVTQRFLDRLFEQQDFSRVVNTFSLLHKNLSEVPSKTWYAIGNTVADAVVAANNQNPAKVLQHLLAQCPTHCDVRTTWATKLLYCHWQRGQSFQDTVDLFHKFDKTYGDRTGLAKVKFPDGVYRVMIQIAVEAEQWEAVDNFMDRLQQIKPSAQTDARILGLLALAKAKMGDWNGVWEDFKKMEAKDRIEDVFVPILKEFVKRHTISEIEDFMKAYIDELQVPVCRYMVNVVANQYGAIRNIELFVNWLEYCSQAGFEVDAAFSNAILTNCRRRWDFSFDELKILFRKLQLLSRNFIDHLTERTMLAAAVRTGHGSQKKKKILNMHIASLGIKTRNLSTTRKSRDPEDTRLEMREAITIRKHLTAISIYKTALYRGLSLDDGHLRLAVNAALKTGPGSTQMALNMIIDAKARGMDASLSTMPVFYSVLQQIFARDTSDKDDLFRQVQGLIGRFEDNGLSLPATALTRAAHLCVKARHFSGAISLAKLALERRGVAYPWDGPTFSLFLMAYTHMVDIQGMQWAIVGAYHQSYFHKQSVHKALKDARNLLSKAIQTKDVRQAIGVLDKAADRVLLMRELMAKERKELGKDAIDIMRQAALEAEQQRAQNGQGPGDGDMDDVVHRKRQELLREIEQEERREVEVEKMRKAARKAEMRERSQAFDDFRWEQDENADEMEKLMMEKKYDVPGGF